MIVFKFLEIGHLEMIMRLQVQGNRRIRFNEIRVHGWKILYAVGKRELYFGPPMTNAFLLNIMTWNVRGLNDRSKRMAVRKQIMLHRPHIITLQETKLGDIDRQIINESVGKSYDCELHNDAQGTAGGYWQFGNHICSPN
jgi:hypothetical protein